MKKRVSVSLVVALLVILGVTLPVAADRSWQISSPRGGKITLVILDTALQNFRIHDLNFADQGRSFSLTAEPARQSQMSQTLEVEFLNGNLQVQKEYLSIGPERTQTAVPCPETFDRIVIQ